MAKHFDLSQEPAAGTVWLEEGSRGHGMASLFSRFISDACEVELVDPLISSYLDVTSEILQYVCTVGSVASVRIITRKNPHPDLAGADSDVVPDVEKQPSSVCTAAAGRGVKVNIYYSALMTGGLVDYETSVPGSLHDRRLRFTGPQGTWIVSLGRGF